MKQQHSLRFTDPAADGAAQQYMSDDVLLCVDGCSRWGLAVWSHESSCTHFLPRKLSSTGRTTVGIFIIFFTAVELYTP